MHILKQSTAVDVLIGPFVDLTDGYTAETGESPTVKLSKNGQALAAKNDVTTPTHDADGYYNCELDATDTDTVGTLTLTVAASANALPVRHVFQVVEEAVYDLLYGASATGPPTAAAIRSEMDSNSLLLAQIVLDTNELQTDLADGGRLDVILDTINQDTGSTIPNQLDIIEADTNELQTDWVNGGRLDLLLDALQSLPGAVSSVAGQCASIQTDTNELQQDWTDGGRLDLIIDAILEDTGELQTDWVNGGRLDLLLDSLQSLPGAVSSVASQCASIQTDTDELQQDWTNGGRLDLILDNILADTNELQADWVDGGRLDLILDTAAGGGGASASAIADAVWNEAQADHTTAGSFGVIASEIASIETKVDAVDSVVDSIETKVDTVDTVVDTILLDTNELQTDWANGGRLDLLLDAAVAGGGGGGVVLISSAFVTDGHTWRFRHADQMTAEPIIREIKGFDGLLEIDFDGVLPEETSINTASITSITPTGVVTINSTAITPNKRAVHLDLAFGTANTYTIEVTVATTDSQDLIRRGKIIIEDVTGTGT